MQKLLIIFLALVTAASDAQGQNQKWFKGNLHTHSYWSDGDEFPEVIVDWYERHGYHFIALSDHNIIASGENG